MAFEKAQAPTIPAPEGEKKYQKKEWKKITTIEMANEKLFKNHIRMNYMARDIQKGAEETGLLRKELKGQIFDMAQDEYVQHNKMEEKISKLENLTRFLEKQMLEFSKILKTLKHPSFIDKEADSVKNNEGF